MNNKIFFYLAKGTCQGLLTFSWVMRYTENLDRSVNQTEIYFYDRYRYA